MKSLPFAVFLFGFASGAALAQPDAAVAEASSGPAEPAPAGVAEEPAEQEEIVVEGEVPKERRRVCEMQTPTGSVMPKRVCRTVAQIEEDQRTAQESLEIMRRDRDSRSFTQMSREAAR